MIEINANANLDDQKKLNGLADSGARTTFETGAQRELTEDKGRCDLLPLDVIGTYIYVCLENSDAPISGILNKIDGFRESSNPELIMDVINTFIDIAYDGSFTTAILELSKHYAAGAIKYADRNWEKGLPLHSFVDSGVRHLLKWCRADQDEPHDRAFLWNMFGLLWTFKHHPELDDYTTGVTIISQNIKNYITADTESCMEFAKRGKGGE